MTLPHSVQDRPALTLKSQKVFTRVRCTCNLGSSIIFPETSESGSTVDENQWKKSGTSGLKRDSLGVRRSSPSWEEQCVCGLLWFRGAKLEQQIEVARKITWPQNEGNVPGDLRSPNMNVTSCEWCKLLSPERGGRRSEPNSGEGVVVRPLC